MTAFDGQQDNGTISNIIEGAKDISQNRNSFYSNQNAVEIQPKEGDLLIFPAYLSHAVNRNLSDEDRVVISFNIDIAK